VIAIVIGVAPGVALTAVKVLGCNGSGTISGVIKGVDWVTANARKPAVANMSLGGGASQALDDAVRRSAASGIVYSIAAGNSGTDACSQSPARAGTSAGVITTAAIDAGGLEPSWSNYGACVDLWAPASGREPGHGRGAAEDGRARDRHDEQGRAADHGRQRRPLLTTQQIDNALRVARRA